MHLAFALAQGAHAAPHPALRARDTGIFHCMFYEEIQFNMPYRKSSGFCELVLGGLSRNIGLFQKFRGMFRLRPF